MKSIWNSWSRNSDSSFFCMILNELCLKVCRCENCHPVDLWIRRGHLPIRTIDELMGFKDQASWNTLHGRTPAQLIWRIYHYLQGLYLSQVVHDFFHQQYLQIIPSFQSLDFQPHEPFMYIHLLHLQLEELIRHLGIEGDGVCPAVFPGWWVDRFPQELELQGDLSHLFAACADRPAKRGASNPSLCNICWQAFAWNIFNAELLKEYFKVRSFLAR